jgi:hypothetical protein
MPQRSVCAEIGVWQGEFSARILFSVRPVRLHLIDPWLYMPAYPHALYGGEHAKSQADMDAIHARVIRRFRNDSRVVIHRQRSADAAGCFSDGCFDWVYVDGDHIYPRVLSDLHAFWPKIKPGGFLTGDDYAGAGWWENGVRRAVDDFVAETGSRPQLIGNQFIIRHP